MSIKCTNRTATEADEWLVREECMLRGDTSSRRGNERSQPKILKKHLRII